MALWVRRCLLVAAVLATWLVARPAAAAAPFCDNRGASGIAPAPTLDIQQASIDTGEGVAEGCEEWLRADQSYERGRRPDPQSTQVSVEAVLVRELAPLPTFAPTAFIEVVVSRVELPGVRNALKRPPR